MVTLIVVFYGGLFLLVITPLIAKLNHYELHHTDLMAGDE
jgi:hypothetical protein